jgi:hypothetical protein
MQLNNRKFARQNGRGGGRPKTILKRYNRIPAHRGQFFKSSLGIAIGGVINLRRSPPICRLRIFTAFDGFQEVFRFHLVENVILTILEYADSPSALTARTR